MGREIVGLIPAAGEGRRISPIPCSKEIYPIEYRGQDADLPTGPRVACDFLLESIRLAGAAKAFVILRQGKWDIPAYLGDGTRVGVDLGYLMIGPSHGVPWTLDQAFPFVREDLVLFGFPDILFRPEDAFDRVLERLRHSEAEIVLGLFPADKPHKMDMVELDGNGWIESIEIKPTRTKLEYTWLIAAWTPAFTRFLHEQVRGAAAPVVPDELGGERELYIGDIVQAGIEMGMAVDSVCFPEGSYIDIGTPDDLARAVRWGLSPRGRSQEGLPTQVDARNSFLNS